MRKRLAGLIAVSAVAGIASSVIPASSATASAQGPCPRGRFCAYSEANWVGSVIVNSAATSGRVEAANDTISSVDNNTNRRWSGWDGRNVLPDRIVYTVAPQTEASYLGDSANDKIDYFTV